MPEVRKAIAYGFAATFRLRDITPCFGAAELRVTKTELVAVFGPSAWAIAFDFGAVAFFGIDSEARTGILRAIEARVGPEPHPPLEEDIDVVVDPAGHETASFDRIVVRSLDMRTFELIALLLAQSVSLDYYDEDVGATIGRLDVIASELERRGVLVRSERELVKLTGAAIVSKDQIIASLALLDKPGITWEDERLDRLYLGLRSVLEIPERFHALESKLASIQATLALYIDLIRHRRSRRVELTVAVLIAVELALLLYQVVATLK